MHMVSFRPARSAEQAKDLTLLHLLADTNKHLSQMPHSLTLIGRGTKLAADYNSVTIVTLCICVSMSNLNEIHHTVCNRHKRQPLCDACSNKVYSIVIP